LFTFHSKAWWRHLWEKTGIVEVKACYEMENPKKIWRPWGKWSKEHLGFDDEVFLDADTRDEVALIVLSAVKKEGLSEDKKTPRHE
jgi:hypothetical protein